MRRHLVAVTTPLPSAAGTAPSTDVTGNPAAKHAVLSAGYRWNWPFTLTRDDVEQALALAHDPDCPRPVLQRLPAQHVEVYDAIEARQPLGTTERAVLRSALSVGYSVFGAGFTPDGHSSAISYADRLNLWAARVARASWLTRYRYFELLRQLTWEPGNLRVLPAVAAHPYFTREMAGQLLDLFVRTPNSLSLSVNSPAMRAVAGLGGTWPAFVSAMCALDAAWYFERYITGKRYRRIAAELTNLSERELIALPALLQALVISPPHDERRPLSEVIDLVKVTCIPARR
jgi:hypothetical protein